MIWSLITSNTTGVENDEEPDDELIEYINKPKYNRGAVFSHSSAQAMGDTPISGVGLGRMGLHGTGPAGSANLETRLSYSKEFRDIEKWQINYLTGTKYEIYRVPFLRQKFEGYKYKDVCMILYHKMNTTLIGLEIKVGNQIKVFLNPSEYVFGECDHWGYVIHHKKPDFNELNNIDLQKQSAENFFIMHYIQKRENTVNKKERLK